MSVKVKIRPFQYAIIILVILVIISVTVYIFLKSNNKPPASENTITPTIYREKAKVSYVLDGDTVEITDKKRVRLIGINTPERKTGNKNGQCFSEKAAKITRSLLENQTIEMEKDVSETDKYGRLLRYIYLDDILINEFLLSAGFARLETIPPDVKYYQLFLEAEKEARSNARGLWKSCNGVIDIQN